MAIRELARRQIGHVTRQQLLQLGLGSAAIGARVSTGALVTRYPGVYALPPARQDPQAQIAAAVLAGGPTALASHTSAAFLWGFQPHFQPLPEITITQGDRRPRDILTHRCHSLDSSDNSLQLGVKVTSRARTLLDLAPQLTAKQLTRTVNNALREHDVRPDALHDVIERNHYHPGTKLLKPFLDLPGQNPTNSSFEDDFLAFIAKYHLPTPLINHPLNGTTVDAYFPEHNLIVELDGWRYHKDRHAFETDRERDAHHLAHGTPTIRITKDRLEHTPDREAGRLEAILSQLLGR
ncbi:MAG TPA: type IV toxin-antitoxin system AbiEi family antitoxin domain-containing protein [Solirubrobacteraceae bacterium]